MTREGVRLKSGETTDLGTLRVKESKSIAGRITDSTGQPVANASISGLSLEGEARLSREARSGADGSYRLSGLGEQPSAPSPCAPRDTPTRTRRAPFPATPVWISRWKRPEASSEGSSSAAAPSPAAFRVQAFPEAKENQERPGMRIVRRGPGRRGADLHRPHGELPPRRSQSRHGDRHRHLDGKAPTRKSGIKVALRPDRRRGNDHPRRRPRAPRTHRGGERRRPDPRRDRFGVRSRQGFKMMSCGRDTAAGAADLRLRRTIRDQPGSSRAPTPSTRAQPGLFAEFGAASRSAPTPTRTTS